MRKLARIMKFIKYNKNKRLMLKVLFYSGFYRFCILHVSAYKNKTRWGQAGEESPKEETDDNYRYAARVSHCVNRVCDHTLWESKCLVRALTTQKLLSKKQIPTTMYLGCGKENGKLIAHAWLRCGAYYFMGGDGTGYAMVEKFRK